MIATPADWEQHIKQLQLLSVEMLELAETGGWEAVSEWETKRRALLDQLLSQPTPNDITPLLVETVHAMLTSDAQLIDMARIEMEKLGENITAIHKGRRACDAYHSL